MLCKNLSSVVTFSNLVETLSFTETAELLKISKSTVSREINQLELLVGGKLIKRTTRKVEITELGYSLYSFCNEIRINLKKIESYIQSFNKNIVGNLSIYAPVSFGGRYITPVLKRILDDNIRFEASLELSDADINFNESAYDIAILINNKKPLCEYYNHITTIGMGLYCSPSFFEAMKDIDSPNSLPKHGYILYSGGIRTRYLSFNKNKKTIKIEVISRFRCNNTRAMLDMALSGQGIAYLPDYIVRDYVTEAKLVKLLPEWSMDTFNVWFLYKNDTNKSKEITLISDYLTKYISWGVLT